MFERLKLAVNPKVWKTFATLMFVFWGVLALIDAIAISVNYFHEFIKNTKFAQDYLSKHENSFVSVSPKVSGKWLPTKLDPKRGDVC